MKFFTALEFELQKFQLLFLTRGNENVLVVAQPGAFESYLRTVYPSKAVYFWNAWLLHLVLGKKCHLWNSYLSQLKVSNVKDMPQKWYTR